MNIVILTGRLTKDPVLTETGNKKVKCIFNIATSKVVNGEKAADFPSVVVWGDKAENLVKYNKKGSLLDIKARINTRTYEKDGKINYIQEIVADQIEYVGGASNNSNSGVSKTTPKNDFEEVGSEFGENNSFGGSDIFPPVF